MIPGGECRHRAPNYSSPRHFVSMLHHRWDLEPKETTLRRSQKVTIYGSTAKDTKCLGPEEKTYIPKRNNLSRHNKGVLQAEDHAA